MIRVEGLTFGYGGAQAAVKDLSFTVSPGEIFGFLGPSGAGKSTTQKILMRLLRGYNGRVEVMGRPLTGWGADYFERIGVCFEFPSHYRKLTGAENLSFFARFFSVPTAKPEELLELVGLGGEGAKRVEQYSKGMQIRLNFARALLNSPRLLFLDEPTAGLDPGNARRIRVTVFLTTHDMTVADELCDRVGFLVDGRLTSVAAPETLRLQHARRAVRVQHLVDGARVSEEFSLDSLPDDPRFRALLAARSIETIHSLEPTLEEVFMRVTGRQLG
jgi:fluoroquinolone transport system ATP-binding protein